MNLKVHYCVELEILTAVTVKSTVLWVETPFSSVDVLVDDVSEERIASIYAPCCLLLIYCLAYSSNLKMVAIRSYETSMGLCRSAQRSNPEDKRSSHSL
jgi:hypothetical protein